MVANSLFGVQFLKVPKYKETLLFDFGHWKIDREKQLRKDFEKVYWIHIAAFHKFFETGKKFFLDTEEKLYALVDEINKGVYDNHFAEMEKEYPSRDLFQDLCNLEQADLERLLDDSECKHYYVTNSVLNECEKLRTKEPYDVAWLQPVPDGKRQFNFGSQFIRYEKKGARIIATAGRLVPRQEGKYFEYTFFNMDLQERTQSQISDIKIEVDVFTIISSRPYEEACRKLFFQLLCFVELAPIEEVFLPARGVHRTKEKSDKFVNTNDFAMTVVSINWNRIIHIGEILVDAFYRLQAHGPRNAYRKLIYISAHSREGYNISALKARQYR